MGSVLPCQDGVKKFEGADAEFTRLGNHLLLKLHALMRMARTYDSKNEALAQFFQESLKTMNDFIEREGSFSLKMMRGDLYMNHQRLRYTPEGYHSFKYLLSQWKKRLIGEVIFKGVIDERMLRAFIYGLADLEEAREDNADLLNQRLRQEGIHTIEVNPLEQFEGEEGTYSPWKGDLKEVAKKIFFETIGTVKEVVTQIRGGQYADVRRLKRLAQKMIHLIMEDESILIGLTTIKNYDEYTYNHSVNVSIYALAMGRRLGLSRELLTELGLAALFHDIGKSRVPLEVLNKPGSLDEREWSLMKQHPVSGVETVLTLKQLGEIHPRMVIGIFDHHLKYNLTGYPDLYHKKEVSLFGRILQIVDAYDAMTTPRVYKKTPCTLEEALTIMQRESGVHFDPILLKVFVGMVGVFPVGSLVLLDSGEVGIVFKAHPDPQWINRPQVMLLEKEETERGRTVIDLSETDGHGHYKWSIVKTLDPHRCRIDVAKYFL